MNDRERIEHIKSLCERTLANEEGMSKNAADLAGVILDVLER